MSTLSRAETAKLAAEIEQLQPVPDWATVDELTAVMCEEPNPRPESAPIKRNFGQCVERYGELDAEIKRCQAEQGRLKEAMQAGVMISGLKKVRAGDQICQMIEKAGSRKIVAEKLLANGVSAEVIAKSTEVSKGSTYMTIRKAAAEDK
jgi:hypothetical protein